ncbi:MAG: ATP-binding protein [Syntrophobacteraceae bacterium]|nr:ATP-binding protein [Syntrophobacteraceae bacterium]
MNEPTLLSGARGKRYYASLTRNMLLVIILVSFTPLVLIAGLIGYYFETSYRQKVIQNLYELVEKHQQHINSFLNERLSDIEFLANSYSYDQLVDQTFLRDQLATLQNAYGTVFVDLGIVNSAGVQISYAGKLKLLHANYSGAKWFRKATKSDHYLSDLFTGLRRRPHFIICVKKRMGDREWLLKATIDFAAFNSLVEEVHIGETGSAFIVNNEGELQSHSRTRPLTNILGLLRMTPWARVESAGNTETDALRAPAVKLISQGNPVSGIVKSRDRNFFFSLLPLKSGEWTLVYQQDRDDVFSEINRARTFALTIFFPGCVAIFLVTLFVSRKMVQKIEKADREKELMNRQVIEANRLASIGELASGVAHEINNPVAVMVEEAGWMEDLLDEEAQLKDGPDVDEFRRCLRQIRIQGGRCKEITHKLLSFARKTDPVPRSIQINDMLEEIVGICEKRSKTNNIRIETELNRNLPPISASPTEMQQVFMNLINNAIDAIGEGGKIELRSRMAGDGVVVDIADTGPGIPADILERVFDPFFTTKPVGRGTGLGLSICYGIVKKLGGSITVESEVGVGATFHVRIPASPLASLSIPSL